MNGPHQPGVYSADRSGRAGPNSQSVNVKTCEQVKSESDLCLTAIFQHYQFICVLYEITYSLLVVGFHVVLVPGPKFR